MNRKMILVFVGLFLANVFGFAGFAQKDFPSGLVLETTFFKGNPPAYQTISESSANAKWVWYSRFQKIPNRQLPAGTLPVQAVHIVPYLENSAVKIKISVFTGNNGKFNEKQVFVAEYSMRENERQTIRELADFGVEPFELAVIRIAPTVSELPTVDNRTNSLQVVSIEPNFSTLPSFKIKLQNNSNKTVSAFAFETRVDNQIKLSGMPQGAEGASLIKAGEIFETQIRNSLQHVKTPDGQIPSVQPNQVLVLKTVVFEDGSYEGEKQMAAQFRAWTVGRKLQLERTLKSLSSVAGDESSANLLDKLNEQISNLPVEIDKAAINELAKEFPDLSEKEKLNLQKSAEGASFDIKKRVLNDLEIMRKAPNTKAESMLIWLTTVDERFRKWLARLP